jgi:hypothetical protein
VQSIPVPSTFFQPVVSIFHDKRQKMNNKNCNFSDADSKKNSLDTVWRGSSEGSETPPTIRHLPPPPKWPKINRRKFLMTAASTLAAPLIASLTPHMAFAAPIVDTNSPIGKKWYKVGGTSRLGEVTSEVITGPGGIGEYQMFEKGVIVYSPDWGAMLLSLAAFNKWQLMRGQQEYLTHQDLQLYIGYPTADSEVSGLLEVSHFEKGAVFVEVPTGLARELHGSINEHFWKKQALLGGPVSEETNATGGGRFVAFNNGDIYWKHQTDGTELVFEVHGAIRLRWLVLGGSGGQLGYPVSDELAIPTKAPFFGAQSRFENGAIFWNPTTGAWELPKSTLLDDYETKHGGPMGPLGFPKGGYHTSASGGFYSDFQNGVIVRHDVPGEYEGIRIDSGTHVFTELLFKFSRVQSGDNDNDDWNSLWELAEEIFIKHFILRSSDGTVDLDERFPEEEETYYDSDDVYFDPPKIYTVSKCVQSDLTVHASFECWDWDVGPLYNDKLGTVVVDYNINNLWGIFDGGQHEAHADGNPDDRCWVTLSTFKQLPYDPNLPWRMQDWWSFHNFDNPGVNWDLFASTFLDVGMGESHWLHPFNYLYYNVVYKSLENQGNCFGMSLESIYAQLGSSIYPEPIYQFFSDTQDGSKLTQADDAHIQLMNQIIIKHGYQLGSDAIDWFLGRFTSGEMHDPMSVFIESQKAEQESRFPVINLTQGYFFSSAHTVRPIWWEGGPGTGISPWVIHIADPNAPYDQYRDDNDEHLKIVIDPDENSFSYYDGDAYWKGNEWFGGRLFYTPFNILNTAPSTPFWEVMTLLSCGILLICSSNGSTQQIIDGEGRTLYQPGLSSAPTQWSQLLDASQGGIPNIARIPFSSGSPVLPIEIHYAIGQGAKYQQEIVPAPGVAFGASIEHVIHSALLSSRLLIPATPGSSDLVTADRFGTKDKSISLTSTAAKDVTWTVAGPQKQTWFELSQLKMAAGQAITISLANGGKELHFTNKGQDTSAAIRFKPDVNTEAIDLGIIPLPAGLNHLDLSGPATTISATGTLGLNGWYTSTVMITLTAQDFSGKGIQLIEYSFDQSSWIKYASPFVINTEGISTIYFHAMDNDNNLGLAKQHEYKIDTRPPVVMIPMIKTSYIRTETLTIRFTATDPQPGSGIATISGKYIENKAGNIDGVPVTDGQQIDLFWSDLGIYSLVVTGSDNAGLVTQQTKNIEIIATIVSIRDTIALLIKKNEIDRDGTAKSLLAKLNDKNSPALRNNLNALIHELNAQSGKHITQRAANLLIGDVQYVLNHLW